MATALEILKELNTVNKRLDLFSRDGNTAIPDKFLFGVEFDDLPNIFTIRIGIVHVLTKEPMWLRIDRENPLGINNEDREYAAKNILMSVIMLSLDHHHKADYKQSEEEDTNDDIVQRRFYFAGNKVTISVDLLNKNMPTQLIDDLFGLITGGQDILFCGPQK